MVHDGGECSALFVKDFSQRLVDICLIDNLIGIGTGECVVEEVVDVIGVSLKEVVGKGGGMGRYGSAGVGKLLLRKACVDVLGYAVQVGLLCAVVEGLGGRVEHVLKDVAVAAGVDEEAVVHLLDI